MTFSLIWTALSFTNIFFPFWLQGVINNRAIEQRNEKKKREAHKCMKFPL